MCFEILEKELEKIIKKQCGGFEGLPVESVLRVFWGPRKEVLLDCTISRVNARSKLWVTIGIVGSQVASKAEVSKSSIDN